MRRARLSLHRVSADLRPLWQPLQAEQSTSTNKCVVLHSLAYRWASERAQQCLLQGALLHFKDAGVSLDCMVIVHEVQVLQGRAWK